MSRPAPQYGKGRFRRPESAPPLSQETGASKHKSPYRRGYEFEVACRGRLQRRGYYVMKSPGSKTKIDLLAVGPPCVAVGTSALFIQCKRTGDIGSAEWNEVFGVARAHHGTPIVCFRPSPRKVAFMRLDAERAFRKPGRPWTALDPETLEPLTSQLALS